MKANKGFTLIELLAVIVILAIIALIATPTILGVIDTAKKGAAESSVLGFVDAIEKQAMINQLDDNAANNFADGTETTYTDTALKTTYGVTVKGETPTVVSIEIKGGEVTKGVFTANNYTVHYLGNGKASAE